MKINKIDSKKLKLKRKELASEAKQILTQKGARAAMVASFVFITATIGTGLIVSYLAAALFQYFGVEISNPIFFAFVAVCVFALTPPAVGGMRHVAATVCDGREVELPEIFIAFSSFERLLSSYLCAILPCLRWGVAVALIYSPDFICDVFDIGGTNGESSPYMLPLILLALALTVLWLMFTLKFSRVSHFVWSGKMSFPCAVRESLKRKRLSLAPTGDDLLGALISFSTCFTYYIFAAGPFYAVKRELYCRREEQLIEEFIIVKQRKDGQKK